MMLAGRSGGKKDGAGPRRRTSRYSSSPAAEGEKIASGKVSSAASPRLRGEGACPRARTRADAASHALTHSSPAGGTSQDDLSPQAGGCKGRGKAQQLPSPRARPPTPG